MSNDTRAARRQKARGGPHHTPPTRDPMINVYIAIGVIIVLIFVAFGLFHWTQYKQIAAAYATPTPVAIPSGTTTPEPLRLFDGQNLGTPYFKLAKGQTFPDTALGGNGKPVDGIQCGGMEYSTLHIHTQLSIFKNGKQIQIPLLIGASEATPPGCLYWIHTHHTDGIIHIEAPQLQAPQGGPYTLGIFFDIWGQPLARNDVAGIKGTVVAYVNGVEYDGDLRAIPLRSHQEITLEVGKPLVPPPNYFFPPND